MEGERQDNLAQQRKILNATMKRSESLSSATTFFQECRYILRKAHETRTPSEIQTLLKLVERSEFLKEVADMQGVDFIKGIQRHAKIEMVEERQVIVEEDQPLNYIVIVLEGKLAQQKSNFFLDLDSSLPQNKDMMDNLSLKTEGLMEKLTTLAKKQRQEMRKASKIQRKTSFPVSGYEFVPPVLSEADYSKALQHIDKNILIHEQFGGKERLNGTLYRSRVFAVEKSILLIFQINFVFYWLEMAFKLKLSRNIQKLKTIPAFEIIEDEKLAEIIQSMTLVKRKKNDIIYNQGDKVQCFYLLVQGQLKLTKEINLFKENPNEFYVDRRRLVKQINNQSKPAKSRVRNNDDQVLHFANLTTLYNYRPVKKSLQIGLVSSYGLFGVEQLIFKTDRQATIQVNSIQASFYQLQFEKVLQIVGKLSDKFKEILELSLSKRILYRQHEFAEQINFQNRTNLNYFFIEEGKLVAILGQHESSPRKLKLEKINEHLAPTSARDTKDHVPAYYTTFNFNKMLSKRKGLNSRGQKQKRKTTNESEAFASPRYNQVEQKIVGISHSWNPIQKKVKQEKIVSRRISPFQHQINISQPLIDQQFFRDVARQQRRINKQFRSIRLSLGKKVK